LNFKIFRNLLDVKNNLISPKYVFDQAHVVSNLYTTTTVGAQRKWRERERERERESLSKVIRVAKI
jgi:hypothetical protein